ncbi:DUF1810 domain-containing protein [Sphingomonas dokdonensis]|uniref:Calpastatin n=1 Tax=Sphingomonas dokdonensis TaxID=344880 RepID=A0A245ZDI0_9SPHN|nr:DUF1810 domain-containing protein [Sphingomonas dokdonensis]OWK27741.1 hypothetical protein SPDO_31050 [Sphingomonas dokdonensis]
MTSPASDPFDLARFVSAQENSHADAVAELRRGRKTSHWMWFVFPQLRALGRSATAQHYGIASLAEAEAYLRHPLLAARLADACDALLAATGSAETILGPVDAMKLRSSMTLFAAATKERDRFDAVLARFYGGQPDAATLALLG